MKTATLLVAAIVVISMPTARGLAASDGDFRTHQSGPWSDMNTWERFNGTLWVHPAPHTPTNTDGAITLTLNSSHTVTVTTDVTVDQLLLAGPFAGGIIVNPGVVFRIANGNGTDMSLNDRQTFTIDGTLIIESGAVVDGGGGNGAATPVLEISGSGTVQVDGSIIGSNSGPLYVIVDGSMTIAGSVTGVRIFDVNSTGNATVSGSMVLGSISQVRVAGHLSVSGSFSMTRGNGGTVGSATGSGIVSLTGSGQLTVTGEGDPDFTFASGSTLQMGRNAVVLGTGYLNIQSGARVEIGSSDGIVHSTTTGNVRTHGLDVYSTAANYIYNGAAAQVTGAALPATVNDLTVHNGAGVTLTNTVGVAGVLTLTSGTLSTATKHVNVTNSVASAVVIASGNIHGTIQRAMADVGTYKFTDANTSIAPGSAPSATVTMTSHPGVIPSPVLPVAFQVQRSYDISVTGTLGSSTLRLAYLDSEIGGGPEDAFEMFRHDGVVWVSEFGTSHPDNNYIEKSGVTTYSKWGIGTDQALPIQLVSFLASASTDGVQLNWGTLSEINNYGFYIQRRSEADAEFTELADVFVPGHGTTLEPQQYNFVDITVPKGTVYYRLRQVDLDGSQTLTDPVQVTAVTSVTENAPKEFALHQNYPNPFNPTTAVSWQLPAVSNAKLVIYDLLGREVAVLVNETMQPGTYHRTFDASGLSSGVYVYRLQVGEKSDLKRMVVVK